MAYSDSYTAKYKLTYQSAGFKHAQVWNVSTGFVELPLALLLEISAFYTALSDFLPNDFAFLGGEFKVRGSNVYQSAATPAPISIEGGGYEWQSLQESRAIEVSFVGKTLDGTQSRLSVFGLSFTQLIVADVLSPFRVERGKSFGIDGAIDVLNGSDAIKARDGDKPIWKQYVNYGFNDFLVKELRG